MKYNVLLTGRYSALMDIFFTHMQSGFDCLSCSSRTVDIFNHLKLYTPDALIFGLNNEPQEGINAVLACKNRLQELGVPLIIVGAYEECEAFQNSSRELAGLVIPRPFTASSLTEKISKFLEEIVAERREQEEMQRAEEQELAESLKKHILVVDDDPLMLKLLREHLREEYDVSTAPSGKVAMRFLEKKTVDLILLDFEMPDENGPAVLQKLHDSETAKDIPVLFLTGVTDKKKIQQALIQKPQGYILKPIDKDKLLSAVKQFV